MENQNLLKTPSYDVVNLNIHYGTEFSSGPVKSFMAFFEVRNVLDETYISAAKQHRKLRREYPREPRQRGQQHLLGRAACLLRRHEDQVLGDGNACSCLETTCSSCTRRRRNSSGGGTAVSDTSHHNHGGAAPMQGNAAPSKSCKEISLNCARTATPLMSEDGTLWLIWDASGRVLVSKSKDLGKTFGAPSEVFREEKASLDNGPDARPKLARDGKGRIIAAFATRDEKYNGKVFLSSSTDDGATFTPARALAPASPSQRFETIAFDPAGRLFTAWIDKSNAAAARSKGEKYAGAALAYTWDADKSSGAKTLIARDNSCECCRISVAFAGAGRPVIMFRNIFDNSVRITV